MTEKLEKMEKKLDKKVNKSAEKADEAGYAILATKMRAEEANEFRRLAARNNTTVSRMLSNMAKDALAADETCDENPCGMNRAVLTSKNVDRLKHEVAFHNPDHLNPDRMLNHILNLYFAMVEEVRRTSR